MLDTVHDNLSVYPMARTGWGGIQHTAKQTQLNKDTAKRSSPWHTCDACRSSRRGLWLYAGTVARFEESVRDILDVTKAYGWCNLKANIFEPVRNWPRDAKKGR